MQSELKPIHEDIKSLKESVLEIDKQKSQIQMLKNRCDQNEETIEALKSIISKQQKSLRGQDADARDKNVMISGLSEIEITDAEGTYRNDEEKVTALFRELGLELPQGYTMSRLGKPNDRYSRIIKLNVINKNNRDAIVKKSKDLREAEEPWTAVYLNHDQHPAEVEENKRLRKKKKMLMNLEENKNKEVKIEKGELKVDNEVVDSNILFR